MSVLLVEDDPGVRQTFGSILERAGFSITAVGGGVAAFAELRKKSFDAVVCDVILPLVDGTSFYEAMRDEFPELSDRVIFVSGWVGDEKIRRLLDYTGQPYLTKPVKIQTLVETVQQIAGYADDKGPAGMPFSEDFWMERSLHRR